LSNRFREGLSLYDLKPQEERLAHVMCLDSLDRGLTSAALDLKKWARRLGLRPDKCEPLVQELHSLHVADVNRGQGTYLAKSLSCNLGRNGCCRRLCPKRLVNEPLRARVRSVKNALALCLLD
jgi:hypothetical protein